MSARPPVARPPVARVPVVRMPAEMAAWSQATHRRGQRIAFVPTMGFLHEGHVSLLREGRRRGDQLALSIFVNPIQFGPSEDLDRYPRDLDGDLDKAAAAGVDVAFVPDAAAMYPPGFQTLVRVRELEKGLCGDRRPDHFSGVATVVLKLFNIVRPHVALFGEKDYQQLQVIRRMAADLDLEIEIAGLPIVREPDGLAMSSRNKYLAWPDERRRALALFQGLSAARARFDAGERDPAALVAATREQLQGRVDAVDYVELFDATTLRPMPAAVDRPAVIAVAAFVGRTRLIDNIRLG